MVVDTSSANSIIGSALHNPLSGTHLRLVIRIGSETGLPENHGLGGRKADLCRVVPEIFASLAGSNCHRSEAIRVHRTTLWQGLKGTRGASSSSDRTIRDRMHGWRIGSVAVPSA